MKYVQLVIVSLLTTLFAHYTFAQNAPLRLVSGTLLASPQAGGFEYNGFNLFHTNGTLVRQRVVTAVNTTPVSGQILGYNGTTWAPTSANTIIEYNQINSGTVTTKTKVLKRYHIEATKASVTSTVPINHSILTELCQNPSGCSIVIGMRDWHNSFVGMTTSRGPYRFFMSETSNSWRLSDTDVDGIDGNASVTHVIQAWDCYFTDGTYTSGASNDSAVGFGLLNWNETYGDPDMVCTLDIEGLADP